MPRQHIIILFALITSLSAAFYFMIPVNLSIFDHNDQAETVVDSKIANVAIPIQWPNLGRVLLPVSVNGAPDGLFMLDTGSPLTVIFGHEDTETIPLKLGGDITVGGIGTGAPAKGRLVEGMEIVIGPVRINDLKGFWLDWENVPFLSLEAEVSIDGIIGYDLFRRFIVELNMANDVLRLHQSLETVSHLSDTPISIQFKQRKPYSKVEVIIDDDKPAPIVSDAMIDTGYNGRLQLITSTNAENAFPLLPGQSVGLQGTVDHQIGRVDQMQFGNLIFENALIEFAAPHGGALGAETIMGMGYLSRFNLVFDYPGQQIFLVERPDSFAAFDLDMSGLEIVRHGDHKIVSNVRPGTSAAEANFRPGNTIARIEGLPPSDLEKVRSLLKSGDGRKISVCRHTRNGEKCKKLRLQRQL